MGSLVLSFQEIDQSQLALVGGKGMHLGKLSRLEGVIVPEGFCITTKAFRQATAHNEAYHALLGQLAVLKPGDLEPVREVCSKIRHVITEGEIPAEVADAVSGYLRRLGEEHAYAVRSSATAEDLPQASFAGQQDSYLNIRGRAAILEHMRQCWASLFTDRAVIYRMQNGFPHHQVYAAVIVQSMVFPEAAGILFTADPVTSNRTVLSIDAGFGLGEALVSGLVSADCYKVQNGHITGKRLAAKHLAVYARTEGGTEIRPVDPARQTSPALTDGEILELARIGRRIETYLGCPQDVEWCLADEVFYILQSRPITTLFPVPETEDGGKHVYLSVGHQQMMMDPIKPLGLSFYLMVTPARMRTAGGRLFVDVAPMLASPGTRDMLLTSFGQSDPLMKDALLSLIERDYIPLLPDTNGSGLPDRRDNPLPETLPLPEPDAELVSRLMRKTEDSIAELKRNISAKSGPALFDFILGDIPVLKKFLFDPQASSVYMAAMNASVWLNVHMNQWLGEKGAADILSQSVPHNITSEMGLALLELADVIRPYPQVIGYLQQAKSISFLEELDSLEGGREVKEAFGDFLDQYGMRCPGEIDITRTRWSEHPLALVPLLLGNLKQFAPEAGRRKYELGRQAAREKEQELLERIRLLPDGGEKAAEAQRKIRILRTCSGFREYPKYGMICRYFVYKQALLREAEQLVQDQVIREKEDMYYLTFEELHEAVRTRRLDYAIVDRRKEEYRGYEKLSPPRVMTSEGEIVTGAYKRENLPDRAVIGLPVSAGVAEGRARVILSLEDARLEEGDILVTSFTDPGWTPLFISIKGLVTEVGGLMTHGAVIAREYGLPAVVGVENATKLIKDGQRIRVNGTDGYIEILDEQA